VSNAKRSRKLYYPIKDAETTELDLKIEIVRDVVATLLKEKEDREEAANNAARKQKILAAIARKQDDELANLSVAELEELAKQL
jgi:hypothetical protein